MPKGDHASPFGLWLLYESELMPILNDLPIIFLHCVYIVAGVNTWAQPTLTLFGRLGVVGNICWPPSTSLVDVKDALTPRNLEPI